MSATTTAVPDLAAIDLDTPYVTHAQIEAAIAHLATPYERTPSTIRLDQLALRIWIDAVETRAHSREQTRRMRRALVVRKASR